MIRTLQKKFIVTAMIAISVFVLVLLGVTNGMNAFSTYRQNREILEGLCANAAAGEPVGTQTDATATEAAPDSEEEQENGKRRFNWFGVDLTNTYKNSAAYFTVVM